MQSFDVSAHAPSINKSRPTINYLVWGSGCAAGSAVLQHQTLQTRSGDRSPIAASQELDPPLAASFFDCGLAGARPSIDSARGGRSSRDAASTWMRNALSSRAETRTLLRDADIFRLSKKVEGLVAAFPPHPALLHTAKRHAQISNKPAVYPDRSGVDLFGYAMGPF